MWRSIGQDSTGSYNQWNSQPNYYGELFMGSYLVQASTITIPETGWLFMSA